MRAARACLVLAGALSLASLALVAWAIRDLVMVAGTLLEIASKSHG